MQTQDIARIRLFHMRTVAGHKGQRVRDHHVLADTHLAHLHTLLVLTGNHAHKGHAVAVFRVHVGLNFKDEAGELLLRGLHGAGVGFARHRRGRPLH